MSTTAEKASQLHDFALRHPDGFTYYDARREFPWARARAKFFRVVRVLRLALAAQDEGVTLPCEPQGPREAWLYRLTSEYEHGQPWTTNRIGDMETRLETVEAVSQVLVSSLDPSDPDWRRARKIYSTVSYLRAELADLD